MNSENDRAQYWSIDPKLFLSQLVKEKIIECTIVRLPFEDVSF